MKKIIRLTENDLARIVRRVISEQDTQVNIPLVWDLSKKLGLKYSKPMGPDQIFFHYGDKASMSKQQIWMDITNGKPTMITVQDERGVKEFPASTPIDKVAIYAKGSANYKKLSGSEPRDVNESRILRRVLNEGNGGYKVGQVFDEVHNRQFIMSLNYSAAGRDSSDTYNDFEFSNPKVVSVSKDGLILKITSGFYNPNDVYKSGQKYDNLSDFCLRIPYHSIQEVRENQLMVSIPNNYLDLYLDKGCTEYNAKLAANAEKAKKCGHTSWESYKKSNWSCNGKSGQVGMNTKECLKKSGFVIGSVGGPATRRSIYEKIFQGSTYQIDITGADTPKKELRIIKKGTTPQVCSSWSCDSSKPLGIKFSGCVAKQQPPR